MHLSVSFLALNPKILFCQSSLILSLATCLDSHVKNRFSRGYILLELMITVYQVLTPRYVVAHVLAINILKDGGGYKVGSDF